MEEWPIDALHQSHLASVPVRLAVLEIALQLVVLSAAVVGRLFDSVGLPFAGVMVMFETILDIVGLVAGVVGVLVGHHLRMGCSRRASFDFSHAENWLPTVESVFGRGRREAEAGRCESSLGPAVVDVSEVPLHGLRRSIEVELVANVDQVLHRGHIHVVDGGEIQNDGTKCGQVRTVGLGLSFARSRVVPGSIPGRSVREGVGATSVLEDGINQIVGIVVGIRVVESFREPVDEDTRVRLLHLDFGVGSVGVIDGEEDASLGYVVVGRGVGCVGRAVLSVSLQQVVADHRVDGDAAKELAAGLGHTEEKDGGGN